MTPDRARFNDLGLRLFSALVLLALAGVAFWLGGLFLAFFVAVLGGAAVWELARMFGASKPEIVGGISGLAIILSFIVPWEMALPCALAAVGISYGFLNDDKRLFVVFHATISIGAVGFLLAATRLDLLWMLWLIGGVVLTDIAGYFAGKLIGGPKFWPSLSPKKTWSGTLGGWVASAIFGVIMSVWLNVGIELALWSVVLSFSSQLGDIFQSFAKRRTGIKDSSGLIPGHGGVWDRFDGLLAASFVFWPLYWII